MKKGFLFGTLLLLIVAFRADRKASSLAGTYDSRSVKLVLKKNHTFKFRYKFWIEMRVAEKGSWTMNGDTIMLAFRDGETPRMKFIPGENCLLSVDGRDTLLRTK